ncbi:MAG: hypothetical protein R2839_04750 [Thermomicrobiales bacterium]
MSSSGTICTSAVDAHSVGWHELRERAAGFTPDRVAAITGLEIDVIESTGTPFCHLSLPR